MAITSPTKAFSELDVATARTLVQTNKPEWFDENHLFYNGDHWQDGEGFADPVPAPSNELNRAVRTGIARIFVSENHIKEVVKRRTDGVLARPPQWEFVEKDQDGEDRTHDEIMLPEITIPLRDWWHKRKAHNLLKRAVTEASLADYDMLRVYVPPARAQNGMLQVSTLEEALDNIYVDMLTREQAILHTDEYSMRDVGVALFTGPAFGDVVSEETLASYGDYVEVTYVDPGTKLTIHKLLYDDRRVEQSVAYDLGGRMLMYQLGKCLLATEQVRQLTRTVNTTLTHMALNNRETNFQQRVFLNAQPPGTVKLDPDTGKKTIEIQEFERGADKDLFVQGVEVENLDGSVDIKNPDLKVIQPSDVRGYVESVGEYRRGLYREAKQLHIELIKDATSTGEARLLAASDFEQDLYDVQEIVNAAGKWLVEVVYALALQLIGETIPENIKASFDAKVTIGPVPQEKRRVLIEEKSAGLRSTFSAMAEGGIENPEEEIRRIQDEIEYNLKVKSEMASLMSQLTMAGIDLPAAAELAGFSEEQIQLLLRVDEGRLMEQAELDKKVADTMGAGDAQAGEGSGSDGQPA